jgi:tryptophan halogenase
VIVGGGAPGWLAAATLARVLKAEFCSVRVIDTPAANGFGEAVLPAFHRLNRLLGIDERDLLRRTCGTFNLGARFADWGRLGERYFHTFGAIGAKLDAVPFHHYWTRLHPQGDSGDLEDYSTASVAARQGRFAIPSSQRTSFLSSYSYGYHFHADLLGAYLQQYAVDHGAKHVRSPVVDVQLRSEDGFVAALQLADGSQLSADLFIDCVGPQGPLFQRIFRNAREDWSGWLPCDRAISVLCASTELAPYSQAVAGQFGWQRRTPLQHCAALCHVYSSGFVGDEAAADTLLADLPGAVLAAPRSMQWSCGRPDRFWDRNCLSLAACGLEPLESTGLHRVQTGITRLLSLFPVCRHSREDIEEYNRLARLECERIRDFLILHYKATTRSDSPLWEHCRQMQIPDTLRAKIELFRHSGRLAMLDEEHFGEESWLAVLVGQGAPPQDYDPLADVLDVGEARDALSRMRSMIQDGVGAMPTLAQFIAGYCPAAPPDFLEQP